MGECREALRRWISYAASLGSIIGYRVIIAAVFALIPSLAAGAPDAPGAAHAPGVAETPTPFRLATGEALFEQKGCLIISADGAEVGCLEHDLDMGDIGTTLRIFGASGPYKGKVEFHLYSGSSAFETAGLDEKAMDKANAYLAKKGIHRHRQILSSGPGELGGHGARRRGHRLPA